MQMVTRLDKYMGKGNVIQISELQVKNLSQVSKPVINT